MRLSRESEYYDEGIEIMPREKLEKKFNKLK